jgi:hypothetical protein
MELVYLLGLVAHRVAGNPCEEFEHGCYQNEAPQGGSGKEDEEVAYDENHP